MKKWFCILLIPALLLSLAACAASAAQQESDALSAPTPASTETAIPEQAAIDAATTPQELQTLIGQYQDEGNWKAVYAAALKLVELAPEDPDAYEAAMGALLTMTEKNYKAIDEILAQGVQNAPEGAEAIAQWARENEPGLAITTPFTPDYASEDQINTGGTTTGNLSSAMKLNGNWRGGFVTSQGDWVYFCRIDENLALYKMHQDGSELTRVSTVRATSLDVIGDWIYYVDTDDNKPYRMRTDGSRRTKLSDDQCSFMTVSGDFMYYDNGSDNGCLYRAKIDGSEKTKLSDVTAMFSCVAGDWAYYSAKSEAGGLLRTPVAGGQAQTVAPGFAQSYCATDAWVYYIDMNDFCALRRVRPDGSENSEILRHDGPINAVNIAGGKLAISVGRFMEEDGIEIGCAILIVNPDTGEMLQQIDARTEPVCAVGSWIYFTEYNDGMMWHGINLDTGDTMQVG